MEIKRIPKPRYPNRSKLRSIPTQKSQNPSGFNPTLKCGACSRFCDRRRNPQQKNHGLKSEDFYERVIKILVHMRQGAFFSIDALVAVVILFLVMLIVYPLAPTSKMNTEAHRDLIVTLSALKIGEINNTYVHARIADGTITDYNKTILEQIGELYIADRQKARELAAAVLAGTRTPENIGIWYENTLIYAQNISPIETATTIETARQSITGIKEGSNTTGFTARAALNNKFRQKYTYFGGYVGDGNLSYLIDYEGNITNASLELATNTNFTVLVNGNSLGTYLQSLNEFTPRVYTLPIASFQRGNNTLELRGTELHVAGGFIKITYESDVHYQSLERHYLSGVQGLINVYDGLSIPGTLNTFALNLHYNASQTIFFTIGNTTIWNGSTMNETTLTLSNAQLQALLNYTALSNTTTPIRIALEQVLNNAAGNADIVLITDLSASMNYRLDRDGVTGITRNCTDPNLYNGSTKRISLAQCLDKTFIDIVLNHTGNRVALVGFFGDAGSPNKGKANRTDYLTSNETDLVNRINTYTSIAPQGLTCICCSINSAYKILNENSESGRQRFIIAMSDGVPTHGCGSANNYEGLRSGFPSNDEALPISSQCSKEGTEQCTTNNCIGGLQNANFSSCRAHTNLGAIVYSIGFGPVKECRMGNDTLSAIAQCGGGKYHASTNASELEQIYKLIAESIRSVTFTEQTANASGIATRLYPDSYLELNYTAAPLPYGLVTNVEKQFTNNLSGTFSLPTNATLIEASLLSYSGPRWTALVSVNNQTIYNLSVSGAEYLKHGDPYEIRLSRASINVTGSNEITVMTGIASQNLTAGSPSNKIIYTIVKNFSSYAPLAALALGCRWTIVFEDNTNITTPIPKQYNGSEQCYFAPQGQSFTLNDAFQTAVAYLLRKLDFDANNEVDIKFTDQELDIELNQVTGIPYTWSTEVQVRVWN